MAIKKRRALDREQLKALEKKVYDVVKPVIDKYDPESLLKLGSPADEYDEVSRSISRAVVREHKTSITELAHIIALALHIDFEMWSQPIHYHGMYYDIAKTLSVQLTFVKR